MSRGDAGEAYHRSTRYQPPPGSAPGGRVSKRRARGESVPLPPPFDSLRTAALSLSKVPPPGVQEFKDVADIKDIKDVAGLREALDSRRSVRDYLNEPVPVETLSFLLWAAGGLSSGGRAAGRDEAHGLVHRTAPSAGGLFPIETYVACRKIDGVRPGVYRYDAAGGALERVRAGDLSRELAEASLGQPFVARAAAVFLWSAVVARTTVKYAARGYRYVYMEAGIASQNVALAATAAGLGSCAVGAFYDDAVDRILAIDGEKEIALLLQAVGVPA